MKKTTFLTSLMLVFSITFLTAQNELKHLSSYQTNTEGVAETVAFDVTNKRAVFTSSENNNLTFIDISNPASPTLFTTIDLSIYGGGPNSIAINGNIIAVAIEANTKQDLGKVVFFDLSGTYVNDVTVGSLPDMLTFTPDGTKVLVANEGEPNKDYSIDPEGSISVIDVSSGAASASVTSINFNSYNDKKESLKNKGIRIFGNNGSATVSQDLEPEFMLL
jgi:DNA-binding beta-propeller fold protein YncE